MLFSAFAFTRAAIMATLALGAVATGKSVRRRAVGHRRLSLGDSVAPASFAHSMKVDDEVTIEKLVTIGQEVTTAKVDVFLLADATGSMGGIIDSVKISASDIIKEVSLLGDVAFGVGQYRDLGDYFVYKLDQDMTTDADAAQAGINAWIAGGGGDWEEANLYALQQVAATTSWRPGTTRILVWFGDAPGHDPSNGVSLTMATDALLAANVKVQALDVDWLDYYGQASLIANATGGSLYSGVDPSNVVDTIENAIENVFQFYSKVELLSTADPTAIQVTADSPYEGTFSRETEQTYGFGVTFKCLMEGTHSFEMPVLVDGVIVATEEDNIICAPKNQPPDCSSAYANPSKLWPPKHEYIDVAVNGVADPDGDAVTVTVTSIYQDEPVNTLGDGTTCADGKITGGQAAVRAERSGTKQVPGDGRVYHINFSADDGKGGTCQGTVQVCVPHDVKDTCTDGGMLYDSTIC